MKTAKNHHNVTLAPHLKDSIDKLNPDKRQKIREILQIIAEKPDMGVALKGKLAGSYVFERSSLKIVYSIK